MGRPHGAENRVAAVASEFAEVDTGDTRLDARVLRVAEKLAAKPAAGFPTAIGDEGQTEGLYRLFRNAKITLWKLLRPHVLATVGRVLAFAGDVAVVHDTTECAFGGVAKRRGLGRVPGGQGFFVHAALAVGLGAQPMPLGVLGTETHFRRGKAKQETSADRRNTPTQKRESARWRKLVAKVVALLPMATGRLIHVMDREADDYLLLETLQPHRFVIRARHDRRVKPEGSDDLLLLSKFLETTEGKIFREVPVSERKASRFGASRKLDINRRYPQRQARLASLKFRAGTITIKRPQQVKAKTSTLTLNVVQVYEPKPPRGQQRIEWTLLTNEAVTSATAVERIVDIYRARWLIEELFKALKTGCAYEKRQLESAHSLMNALGIFLPIAWSLLRLRAVARVAPGAPATAVLTEVQLKILPRMFEGRRAPRIRTALEAHLALAKRGGHLTNNGPPGWQTLARGYEDLLVAEIGYRIAKEEK